MQDVIRPEEQYSIVADTHRPPSPQRVLKQGDSFGVFDQHGDVIASQAAELGLYHHGTRFLSRLELRLGDSRPLLLSSTVTDDNAVLVVDFTNLDMVRDGSVVLPRGEIHVLRSRLLMDGGSIDRIRVSNYGRCATDLPLSFHFASDFADVFEVRGTRRERRGTLHPVVVGRETVLRYAGLDGIERRTRLTWSPAPDSFDAGVVVFHLHLEPRETIAIEMTVLCEEGDTRAVAAPFEASLAAARRNLAARAGAGARVRASSESFNRWINRSTADLTMMATHTSYGL